jgi:AcrR family transcriptional regulator
VKNSGTIQKWINAGYEILAAEGPEGIHVERLARELGHNKSGFYHYFGDREIYFSKLMEYHYKVNGDFHDEILLLKLFDPDYINLLVKYRSSICVQAQLKKNLSNPLYMDEFIKNKIRNDKAVIPLWASYLNITNNLALAQELWDIIRDVFFMRFNSNNLCYEFIHDLVYEFSKVVDVLKRYNNNSNSSPQYQK